MVISKNITIIFILLTAVLISLCLFIRIHYQRVEASESNTISPEISERNISITKSENDNVNSTDVNTLPNTLTNTITDHYNLMLLYRNKRILLSASNQYVDNAVILINSIPCNYTELLSISDEVVLNMFNYLNLSSVYVDGNFIYADPSKNINVNLKNTNINIDDFKELFSVKSNQKLNDIIINSIIRVLNENKIPISIFSE